jgi:membrane-associated phospholipid phosphatase
MQDRVRLHAAVLAFSSTLFAGFAFAALVWQGGAELDVRFVDWVHGTAPGPLVDLMRLLTYAGSAAFLCLVAAGAALGLVRIGRRRAAAFIVVAFASSELLDQLLKEAFRRARPELEDPFVRLTTYAFPSGHALGATATYGALALVVTSMAARRHRALAFAVAAAIVALVAASRVILGVHYLLDVAAGVAAGIALLSALLLLFERQASVSGLARLPREKEPEGPGLDA